MNREAIDQSLDTECYNAYYQSMPTTLRDELRQQKPFRSLFEEALLNVARTDAVVREQFERVLAPRGLSMTQYNVLRILRGAGANGLCRNEIGQRLINRMPDVSRLLDRMEAAGLVSRVRSTEDRRLVNTTLTDRGLALVDALDEPVARYQEAQLGHMTEVQLRSLIELLSLARSNA
jgi:DNA-binding MarR family transcriptional regulator